MGKIRTLNMEQYYANKEALSKQSKAEQRAEATRLAAPIPPRRGKLHMTKEQMEQREHFLEQRKRSRYKNKKPLKATQVSKEVPIPHSFTARQKYYTAFETNRREKLDGTSSSQALMLTSLLLTRRNPT